MAWMDSSVLWQYKKIPSIIDRPIYYMHLYLLKPENDHKNTYCDTYVVAYLYLIGWFLNVVHCQRIRL